MKKKLFRSSRFVTNKKSGYNFYTSPFPLGQSKVIDEDRNGDDL